MTPPEHRPLPCLPACGIALALMTLLSASACTQDRPSAPATATTAPALTTPQAELLALTRFTNYRHGVAQVTADIPVQGHFARLTGRLDWRRGDGLAVLQGHGGVLEHGRHLLRWNRTTVSIQRNWTGPLPSHPPRDGWAPHTLTPRASAIDTTLLLLLNLAADRPDNAQLLLHSGARRLGAEKVAGVPVTVFAGPSATSPQGAAPEAARTTPGRTRYWIDADGRLRRFSARLSGGTEWLVATFAAPSASTSATSPKPTSTRATS
ncbi:hypothetical protein [Streptomyces sp. FIT100]|uniref:hypothetical protein n=1 Tax=Streptomyces sp. FIT100 TaxID=2837956 RepID=UPI0021C95B1A|nr:hypothetical protein [Streptomyces sp. FIT100]UUN28848.1 hypothetical protein KK483_22520 [Streptomyces sp. FIT100]